MAHELGSPFQKLPGDHFGVSVRKCGDHFGVGLIAGSIWGSFRGQDHFRVCTVSDRVKGGV